MAGAAVPHPSRFLVQAEDAWRLVASPNQYNTPVTEAWTWITQDLWQLPRDPRAIVGSSIFHESAAAATVKPGTSMSLTVTVPDAGRYRLFARVLDYRTGRNAATFTIAGVSRAARWGYVAAVGRVLAKMRKIHDLPVWLDLGPVDLPRGACRLDVRADDVGQPAMVVDAIFGTANVTAGAPSGWNPLFDVPVGPAAPVKKRRTIRTDEDVAAARANLLRDERARRQFEHTLRTARAAAALTDAELWSLVPSASSASDSRPDAPARYRTVTKPALEALGESFLLTGDPRLSHAASVLLVRLADAYPNGFDRRNLTFRHPYSPGSGMLWLDGVGSASDPLTAAACYDAVFETIDADTGLLQFVGTHRPELTCGADIRWFVEERLLRVMGQAVVDGAIYANPGAHDLALIAIATCLDDFGSGRSPDSAEMLRWLFDGQPSMGGQWRGPRRYLSNTILPDGCYHTSTDYNSILQALIDGGALLERLRRLNPAELPIQRFPRLVDHPRLRQHLEFLTGLVCLNRYHPAFGDGHGKQLWEGDNLVPTPAFNWLSSLAYPSTLLAFLREHPDPDIATLIDERDVRPRSVFLPSPVPAESRAPAATGALRRRRDTSTFFDDYGVALMRAGSGETARALWINYKALGEHRNRDRFSMGVMACGLDLMPVLPYPQTYTIDTHARLQAHPLLHNTVTFDREDQGGPSGHLVHFASHAGIQQVQVRTSGERTTQSRYVERTVSLVDIDDRRSYVVDHVSVVGGTDHHLGFNPPGPVRTGVEGATLQSRPGTVASPTGRFGDRVANGRGEPRLHPFGFMTNVRTARVDAPFVVEWAVGGERDVHLRLHGLPEAGTELILATARPPVDPTAYSVERGYLHRGGSAPLTSTFLSVLEPYEGSAAIERIDCPADFVVEGAHARAFRVVLAGREDIWVVSPTGCRATLPDGTRFEGQSCCLQRVKGILHRATLTGVSSLVHRGFAIRVDTARVAGEVMTVDRARNVVVVSGLAVRAASLAGRMLRIENDFRRTAYLVRHAVSRPGGAVEIELDRDTLLAEGAAVGFETGILLNSLPMPHVSAGCRVESEAGADLVVETITHAGHAGKDLLVRHDGVRPTREMLASLFPDGRYGVYAFGVGDRVVVEVSVDVTRTVAGRWRVNSPVPVVTDGSHVVS